MTLLESGGEATRDVESPSRVQQVDGRFHEVIIVVQSLTG